MPSSRRALVALFASCVVASVVPKVEASQKHEKKKRKKQRRCQGLKTALQVLQGLQAAGLPIGTYEDYTVHTDPNEMMGRPGGYISKVNFLDTRLERDFEDEYDVSDGGSIEFFANTKNLQARVKHLEFVQATIPFIESEVMVTHGTALLRVSGRLLIADSNVYRAQFRALRVCS